jgi:PAP_fibrillin
VVSQQPDLSFAIPQQKSQTWLLTTFLDEDTRIARGDGGSVFVLVKEVSLAPSTPPEETPPPTLPEEYEAEILPSGTET